MVTITRTNPSKRGLLLLGLASLGAVANGHLVMASNPFFRSDRALQRLTRMLDELVQPLWRRVVQQPLHPPQTADMTHSPPALAPDASVLAFRAEAIETADSYVIQADLPGVKRENVRIAFHDGNVLGITATRSNPFEAAKAPSVEEQQQQPGKAKNSKGKDATDVDIAQPAAATEAAGADGDGNCEAFPKYLMREIAYGKSYRSFKLPSDASPETATARFEEGVLTIVIKKREQPKEKLIEIQ